MIWLILLILFAITGGVIWYVVRQRTQKPTLSAEYKQDVGSFLIESAQKVEPVIQELLAVHAGKRFHEAMTYQVVTGGKKLRPALVLLGARSVGGRDEDVLYAAAAVEILHNYSLIIDDMIDHSQVRRGQSTVWKKWGRSMAECLGVHYAAAVFDGALRTPCPVKATKLLVETLQVLLEGEMLDIFQERAGREDELLVAQERYKVVHMEDYIEMASKKTAKLLATSCLLGGLCAGASVKEQQALSDYGFNLGMAFQVQDDILDIFGEEEGFGKKIGKDIEERKGGNAVILFALEELTNPELDELLHRGQLEDNDIKRAIQIISQTQAREKALQLCRRYTEKARAALVALPAGSNREIMNKMISYLMSRDK